MPTPHNAAQKGQIAKTVLMPGDPLRAQFIAETFLQNPREFNHVRGMLGYTGTYNGRPVSVMGSGMGMPSIGIYSYELFAEYDVDNIIRLGSAGSYTEELNLFDVLLVTSCYSESSYAKTQNGTTDDIVYPSGVLCEALRESAGRQGVTLAEGRAHSSDVFYRENGKGKPYWQLLRDELGCLAVEMESFALFHNAKVCGKHAACLLTISDNFTTPGEITTAEQRQNSFTAMMQVALGVV